MTKTELEKQPAADARKRMMIALGVEIFIYGAFALVALFFVFIGFAESGSTLRHGPAYERETALDALCVLWPLVELIVSWIWVANSTKRYAESKVPALGNGIAASASFLAPVLFYLYLKNFHQSASEDEIKTAQCLIMIGIPFIGHWTARLLWLTRKTALDTKLDTLIR